MGRAICAALVFFMQAGFAMLESGMVRSKNAINVIMKNYTDMCFGALAFWAIGYGIMFGTTTDGWGLFGTDSFMLEGSSWDYMILTYQMMFAATAATIVSGALAERIRFGAYVLVAILITSFVYPVFGCWVWNEGGWLNQMGFIDFAGSSAVHSVGGWCALAGLIVLGPRLKALTGRLVQQFSEYSPLEGRFVDGKLTLGENIADLSGLAISHKAPRLARKDKPEQKVAGWNSDQLFFVGWSRIWQRKYRDSEMIKRLATDSHSPSRFRTNGPVSNIAAFYEAFGVEPGDKLFKPESERIKIW